MGGGPSAEQKAAAAASANLSNTEAAAGNRAQGFVEAQQNKVNPFYTSRMQSGVPYFNQLSDASSGLMARAFAPFRAELYRQLGSQQGLPSGFRQQAFTDLDTQQARAFDEQLLQGQQMNEQARQGGAAGLMGQAQIANPTGYFGQALQGNQSIMQAPLQRPGVGGLLGGVAGGLATKIPF